MEDFFKHPNFSKVTFKLLGEILKMPRQRQEELLQQLSQQKEERRVYQRNPWMGVVDYTDNHHALKGYIRNISASGAYIEPATALDSGRAVTLVFDHPYGESHLKVKGEIAWKGGKGMGVRFRNEVRSLMAL